MIEVLKQMVEALEWCHGGEPVGTADAIQAGKKLIAELESQKPVENRFVRELREYGKTNQGAYLFPSWDIHRALKYLDGYTTPQQRTWVCLTDEDLSVCDEDGVILARYWEAKLKDKNL